MEKNAVTDVKLKQNLLVDLYTIDVIVRDKKHIFCGSHYRKVENE